MLGQFLSGRPGSNRPPRPWQGRALPNELLPLVFCKTIVLTVKNFFENFSRQFNYRFSDGKNKVCKHYKQKNLLVFWIVQGIFRNIYLWFTLIAVCV
jgi:hypothetical protein